MVPGIYKSIGAESNFRSFPSDAFIDEVSLCNIALDSISVKTLLGCPPLPNASGLEGYWDFQEGIGTTTADRTSNSYDGILMNGPVWATEAVFLKAAPNPILNVISGDINLSSPDHGLIMKSPNGTRWKMQVDDSGNISVVRLD